MKSVVTGAAFVLGSMWVPLSTHCFLEPSHNHVSLAEPPHVKLYKLKFREVVSSRGGHTVGKTSPYLLLVQGPELSENASFLIGQEEA